MDFWTNFINLCNKKGVSPSKAAKECGYSSAILSKWKDGSMPRQATLFKISDYFGIGVDELVGLESYPTPTDEDYSPAPPKKPCSELRSLISFITNLNEEQCAKVMQYAMFVANEEK